ncbi:MAG: hypothetical protein EOR92_21765 [Mesorhizobium sp.]|nr:MAG: hypothetical protein EOQ56_02405 [Mesorhizobium sp.]RWQ16316.1 MAG: hypothetical protein EOR92_21765 [Mesorhizobium sp.]
MVTMAASPGINLLFGKRVAGFSVPEPCLVGQSTGHGPLALTAMAIATRHKRTPLARFIAREASFVSAFPEIALMNCWRYLKCTDAKMVPGMARFFFYIFNSCRWARFSASDPPSNCLRSQRAAIGPPTTKADGESKKLTRRQKKSKSNSSIFV